MFKALYAVARHTALHLIVTPNGEQLKVICMPKPSGNGSDSPALQKPFSIAGTPEELETAFPDALAKYSEAVNGLRAALDLPLDALEAAQKKAAKRDEKKAAAEQAKKESEEKRKAAAQQAAKTRAENAAKKKAEDEAKAKARGAAKEAKKKAKGAGKPLALPGATSAKPTATWPFPIGAPTAARAAPAELSDDVKHRAGLPGKTECVRDYRQLKLKHGDKLTRRLFIKKAETGRRYEKLWANWAKFVRDAEAQGELPLDAAAAAGEEKPAGQVTAESLADDPPPKKGEGKGTGTDVYDQQGNYLSSIATAPKVGEHIGLVSQDKLLRVVAIDTRPSGGLDVTVVPDPEYTAQHAEKIAAQVRETAARRKADEASEAAPVTSGLVAGSRTIPIVPAPAPATKPTFGVYARSGELLKASKWPFQIGERLELEGENFPFRVQSIDEADPHRYIARKILPLPQRLVSEAGEKLGESEEIYLCGEKVGELAQAGDYQVVRITLDAYIVRDVSKPRWTVWNIEGTELGTIDAEPVAGDKIDVGSLTGLTVIEVDGYDVTAAVVKPRLKGPVAAATPATTE